MQKIDNKIWTLIMTVLGVLIALMLVLTIVVRVTGTASSKAKGSQGPEVTTEAGSDFSPYDVEITVDGYHVDANGAN